MAGRCIAIELNDALLAVADESGVRYAEPGYLVVVNGMPRFGADAMPVLRRHPAMASTRHWVDLGEQPLRRPLQGFTSTASIVAGHLRQLWQRFGADDASVAWAVPAWWSEEQQRVLAELSRTLGLRVRAVADAAVAACRHEYPGRELLQLDAGLHGLAVTRIRQAEQASPGERADFPTLGIEPLLRVTLETLARRFVAGSRFDPLHDAEAEQALFDQLPNWLPRLAADGDVTLSLTTRSGTFAASVQGVEFRARLGSACEPLLQKLRASIAERGPHVLQVHHRLAEFPGVLEALVRLPGVEVHVLGPGAAALGLLGRLSAAIRPGPTPERVSALPWDQPPAVAPEDRLIEPGATAHLPTHVLVGHRAFRLGAEPFRVGAELSPGEVGVALDPGLRGLSRRHCTLRRENGALLVFDHSRFGTWLNGHRISGAVVLQPGDVLAVGTPAVELRLLAEVGSDGA